MAKYQPTVDIWKLNETERAGLQVGQYVKTTGEDRASGIWCGKSRGGTDVVAWLGNARGFPEGFHSYTKSLRRYAAGGVTT